jgi:hypothetical protein
MILTDMLQGVILMPLIQTSMAYRIIYYVCNELHCDPLQTVSLSRFWMCFGDAIPIL